MEYILCHGPTMFSPYHLVYGHDAMLPWEIKIGSRRLELQDSLIADDYKLLMNNDIEDLSCHLLRT